jgi:hypothetical protein
MAPAGGLAEMPGVAKGYEIFQLSVAWSERHASLIEKNYCADNINELDQYGKLLQNSIVKRRF